PHTRRRQKRLWTAVPRATIIGREALETHSCSCTRWARLYRRSAMDEVFPVLAGVVLGLVAGYIPSSQLRALVIVVLSAVLGAAASWISGELLQSWFYVAIDTAQVAAAG